MVIRYLSRGPSYLNSLNVIQKRPKAHETKPRDFFFIQRLPISLYTHRTLILLSSFFYLQIVQCPDWQSHCPRLDRKVCIADFETDTIWPACCQKRTTNSLGYLIVDGNSSRKTNRLSTFTYVTEIVSLTVVIYETYVPYREDNDVRTS